MSREFTQNGQTFNQTIPAGRTIPLNQKGTNFYVVLSTGVLSIRARGPRGISPYTDYAQGTGRQNSDFDILEIKNTNAFDVVCSVWVGDPSYIDRRLILNSQQQAQVVNPLYTDPTHHPVTSLPIPDISGGAFFDINGKKWLAISRIQILMSNVDTGQVQLLQKLTNATYDTGAVFAVQPATEVGPAFSGDYRLVPPSGNLNCIVVEVYQAIPG